MILPQDVETAILAHAVKAVPEECCGLLVGTRNRIVEAVPARNIAEDSLSRYVIDPADHFAAMRDARRRSLDVIGAYHSHPRSAAMPSPVDAAQGFGDFIFVIAGLVPAPQVTGWTWSDGNFMPLPLVRVL